MRQLLSSCPPSMVSAKWTSQLSAASTLARPAAMPPSAITVCALPSSDFVTTATEQPASAAAMAARMPAPPAPTTRTSQSIVSYGSRVIDSEDDMRVGEDAGVEKVDVDVGDDDAEHAHPCPHGVAPVQYRHPGPRAVPGHAGTGVGVAIEPAPDEMPQ